MRGRLKFIIILSVVFVAVSCLAPTTKESYLDRFEKFVERVEDNHKKYSKKDWEWADDRFEKFNNDWYLHFRDEFTLDDQIKIKGLIIKYHSLKNRESIGDMLRDLFKDDINQIGDKVQEYIDTDLDEDLDQLIEGATEIGDSTVKVLEDIVKELEETF